MRDLVQYQSQKIVSITQEDVKKFLIDGGNGFKQLILELTCQCNFRCKYCCYSDCYELTHGYSNDYMSFEVAKKAVDFYVGHYMQTVKRNPLSELFISFYGGEPLLNFTIIKQVVEYVEEEYSEHKFSYNITTNGYLLNDQISQFLVEKDFAILVSLDGDENEQNRNRVNIEGNATFDKVIYNVRRFKETYPEYVKFSISACYDWKTDLIKVKDFFEREKLNVTKFSPIDSRNTSYYEQFTTEDMRKYDNQLVQLKNEMCRLAKEDKLTEDRFVFQTLGVGYLEFAYHTMIGDSRNSLIPYTGTCIPGEKIYVTPDGKVHVCEKINPNYSIGNIDDGLDFKQIAHMINTYNKKISKHCIKCEVNKLCSNCFVKFAGEQDFTFDSCYCNRFKIAIKNNLVDMVNLLEENPSITERLTVGYYDHIMKYTKGC